MQAEACILHPAAQSADFGGAAQLGHTGRTVDLRRVSLQLLTGREHYDLLVDRRIRQAAVSLWIATANVKALHLEAPVGTRARARGRYVSIVETRIFEYHGEKRGDLIMTKEDLLAVGDRWEKQIAEDRTKDAPYR